MYQRGVRHFAFDSRDQVDNLAANAPGSRVYLRLYTSNKGSKLDLSKRLGVHHADAPELLTYAAQSGLEPFGLTFHVGSQCSEIQNWETGIRVAARLFERFSSLDTLNLGGGFPVPYNESVVSLDQINHTIQAALADSFPRRPRLWVEPGRFLMGPAAMIGASVTQVEDRKPVARAVVDMSLFTGLMEKLEFKDGFEYPIETDAEGKNGSYTLLGPTCDGEDVLAVEIPLPRLHVDHRNPRAGSRIFIGNTGAYTLEYSPIDRPHGFNGARVPSVWFLETGRIRLGGEW
jgi:ornithine decarboxylase